MSPELSAVILNTIKDGVINSVSVDVCNEVALGDAKKLLETGLLIGLHFNLTERRPIGHASSKLLDTRGRFKGASLGLLSNMEAAAVFQQMRRQLERFQVFFDRLPNHIDSHQHFAYLHPSAFDALLQLSTTAKVPIRSLKPFINVESLRGFCERVRSRYGISFPFRPEDRAYVLSVLFNRYGPQVQSQDLYLDFDHKILSQIDFTMSSMEMIIHPHLQNTKAVNGNLVPSEVV